MRYVKIVLFCHRRKTLWTRFTVKVYSKSNRKFTGGMTIYQFIYFLLVQQLHQSRATTTSQNRDTMSKPGRKGR